VATSSCACGGRGERVRQRALLDGHGVNLRGLKTLAAEGGKGESESGLSRPRCPARPAHPAKQDATSPRGESSLLSPMKSEPRASSASHVALGFAVRVDLAVDGAEKRRPNELIFMDGHSPTMIKTGR
jgi:hypothetical protein